MTKTTEPRISMAGANYRVEIDGEWVGTYTTWSEAREMTFGRSLDELRREAAEGPDGDPFAGFPR